MLEGLRPSVGAVGDALDNALCETTIGLYKTECVREGSPFRAGPIRTFTDLENITSAWVSWYNERRLMRRLGRRPPAEAEANYYARLHAGKHPVTRNEVCMKPGMLHLRDDPVVRDWAGDVVGDALAEAERAALDAHRRALTTTGGKLDVRTSDSGLEGGRRYRLGIMQRPRSTSADRKTLPGNVSRLLSLPELPDHNLPSVAAARLDDCIHTTAPAARRGRLVVPLRARLGRDPRGCSSALHPSAAEEGSRDRSLRHAAGPRRSTLGETIAASTAAATPSAELPLGDQLVLSERPLRPGAVLAETARFGDDVWPLSPAQLQHHQDHMRLNFALVPAPCRQTAKRLFYAMLSGDLPPGERRPRVTTTPVLLVEVKRFFCWLEQHFADHGQPPPTLACLTPADLHAYRKHVAAALSPVRAARACMAVRYLWRYRRRCPTTYHSIPCATSISPSMDPRFDRRKQDRPDP